ncbi:GapS1 family protein [Shewanella algae]|uniref:GapS1 family protein n=1 Tax=Shewanella algae TaxID=38313 RepID=UPI0034D394D2
MSFINTANDIRNAIRKYDANSIIIDLLKRLHTKHDGHHKSFAQPWILCLMLDWTLELAKTDETGIVASSDEVYEILNRIFNLQSKAIGLEVEGQASSNIFLKIRPFLLSQLMFQREQMTHLYFMMRLHAIMSQSGSSGSYKIEFKRHTGIELDDFIAFGYLMFYFFAEQRTSYSDYSQLIVKLYPAFSIKEIATMLNLVGADIKSLSVDAKQWREGTPLSHMEYFSEPFTTRKPILLLPKGFSTPHSYVATIGMSEMLLRVLKNNYGVFREKFTKDYERYVAEIVQFFNPNAVTESALKAHYQVHGKQDKKVVDFLLSEHGKSVFIDAKGTEPHERLLYSANPTLIKDKLKSSHLKAIEQACECAQVLEDTGYPDNVPYDNRYALVVTHQDFYLGDGRILADYLGTEHEGKITQLCAGKIPLANVHFLSIENFEAITQVCKDKDVPLYEFLDFCKTSSEAPKTQKFDMSQHIAAFAEHIGSSYSYPIGSALVEQSFANFESKLSNILGTSEAYWRQGGTRKIPEFLKCHQELTSQLQL